MPPKPHYPFLRNEEYVVFSGEVSGSPDSGIFGTNPFGWIGIKTNLPAHEVKGTEDHGTLKDLFLYYSRLQHPNIPINEARHIALSEEAPSCRITTYVIADL